MPGSIANIAIKLVANPEGLTQGLSAAERRLSKFAGETKSLSREIATGVGGIGGALTGLAIAGTGAGLAAGIKSSIDYLDDLGDKAAGIGETAQNLGELDYVATRTGSSAEAAEAGLAKFVKAVGEAQSGSGPAAEAFDKLGLSAKTLGEESPVDAMLETAAAIGELPSVYERAAVSAAIFGKGAAALQGLFANTDQISEYREDFHRLHGNMDRAAEVAGAAQDQFDRLKEALRGLGETAVLAFGPEVEKLVGDFADGIGKLNNSDAVEKIANSSSELVENLTKMPEVLSDVEGLFSGIAKYSQKAAGWVKIIAAQGLYLNSTLKSNALLATFPATAELGVKEYPLAIHYRQMADSLMREGTWDAIHAGEARPF